MLFIAYKAYINQLDCYILSKLKDTLIDWFGIKNKPTKQSVQHGQNQLNKQDSLNRLNELNKLDRQNKLNKIEVKAAK